MPSWLKILLKILIAIVGGGFVTFLVVGIGMDQYDLSYPPPNEAQILLWAIVAIAIYYLLSSRQDKERESAQVKDAVVAVTAAVKKGAGLMSEINTLADKKVGRGPVSEEAAFEIANEELQEGNMKRGLWAKALADAMGDEQKQKALYLKYRAEQLIDSVEVTEPPSETVPKTEPEEAPKPPVDQLTAEHNASRETGEYRIKTSDTVFAVILILGIVFLGLIVGQSL